MKVLFVTSEAVPFVKTGGLADVSGILPRELKKLGVDIRVVLPRYYAIDPARWGLVRLKAPLGVPMGVMGEAWCGVYEGKLPGSDVKIYFIEHEGYFGRDAIYNDERGEGFSDNDKRFVFFSRAALQLAKMLDFAPDVVHINDWQTAAIAVMLNTVYKYDAHLGRAASLLTIHNLQYQGVFFKGLIDVMQTGWQTFTVREFEFYDCVNLLKGGISNATVITTVSPKYASEIKTPEFGWGLDDILRYRWEFLRGIINGVDYDEWSPQKDAFIKKRYSFKTIKDKEINKRALQKLFGLPQSKAPLFGMVTRLAEQKGIDLVRAAIHRILALDLQFVLVGSGSRSDEDFFRYIASLYPQKFNAHIGYSNSVAHMVEAGADFFVMPSKFEPCGLNQIYSLAYGTLPIVRAVGGLDDTVENFDERTGAGTGFKFYDHTPNALFDTIGWATYTYYHRKKSILALQKNAMNKDFSWKKSAKEYLKEYERAAFLKNLR